MLFNTKSPSLAYIRADECIGCTKCIQACPFDAILGTAQYLHTVLVDKCVGCGLCVEPCPVDCIEMHAVSQLTCQPEQAKKQVQARKKRLKALELKTATVNSSPEPLPSSVPRATYVKEALIRARTKRKEKR